MAYVILNLVCVAALVGIDQAIKLWATQYLAPVEAITVIPHVVELRFVLNQGMAFSLLSGRQLFLILTTTAALLLVAYMLFFRSRGKLLQQAAFILVLAGGIGNLIDRVLNGEVVDYINPVMQSNGKALSQNANWAAANGLPLTKRQQAMMDAVDKLAKPIGQETTLYRADHDDFLKRLKVNNYQNMSDSQLRKALVGKTWTNECLESTAYDSRDNPFWPQPNGRSTGKSGQGGSVSGNREVLIRYHTAKSARAAFIQPSQSEAVLAVGTHHKITGVRSTRTGPSHTYLTGKRVIELEIEVW